MEDFTRRLARDIAAQEEASKQPPSPTELAQMAQAEQYRQRIDDLRITTEDALIRAQARGTEGATLLTRPSRERLQSFEQYAGWLFALGEPWHRVDHVYSDKRNSIDDHGMVRTGLWLVIGGLFAVGTVSVDTTLEAPPRKLSGGWHTNRYGLRPYSSYFDSPLIPPIPDEEVAYALQTFWH